MGYTLYEAALLIVEAHVFEHIHWSPAVNKIRKYCYHSKTISTE